MADYLGLETADGHLLAEDGGGLLLETSSASTDVLIPAPGAPRLCGPTPCGTVLCGSTLSGDAWANFPLDNRPDVATVETTRSTLVAVEDAGFLDLDGGTGQLRVRIDVIIPEPLLDELLCGPQVICGQHLCGEGHGDRYTDYPLALDGDTIRLVIEVILRLIDSVDLDLAGVVVRVNPVLMPSVCLDLDLAAVTCTPLDLTPSAVEEIDLAVLDCLEA